MKRLLLALCALLVVAFPAAAEPYAAKLGDDGLYHQDWFVNSFLDLKEDLADAAKANRRLAIVWEQKGCPYCRDVHTVNFADDALRNWIKDRFAIVQLNLWGDRDVTDFDGQVLPEKELARKYRVMFTPTIQFFPATAAETEGKRGDEAEVARMPGYFRNFHFLAMFEYVWDKRYAKGQDFQRYILEKSAAAN